LFISTARRDAARADGSRTIESDTSGRPAVHLRRRRDETAVRDTVTQTAAPFGRTDVVANNAGHGLSGESGQKHRLGDRGGIRV
jgi:NAD(P)-dependent dehydrogenase (short-subunit alcohol dehydrogenase family)